MRSVRLDLRLVQRVLVEAVWRFIQRILTGACEFSRLQILDPFFAGPLVSIVHDALPDDQYEEASHDYEQHDDCHEEQNILNVWTHFFAKYLDVYALGERLKSVDELVFAVILIDHNAAFHQRWFEMVTQLAGQLNCGLCAFLCCTSIGLRRRRSVLMRTQIAELFHHLHVELAVLLAVRFVRARIEGVTEHARIVECAFLVTGRTLVAEATGPDLRWQFARLSSLALTPPTVADAVSAADLTVDRTHTGRLVQRALARLAGPAVHAVALLIAASSLATAGQTAVTVFRTRIVITFAVLSVDQ